MLITIKLTEPEIQAAIGDYLESHGYDIKEIRFSAVVNKGAFVDVESVDATVSVNKRPVEASFTNHHP